MKNLLQAPFSSKARFRFVLLIAVFGVLSMLTPLSGASVSSLTITVVNNSGWEMRNLYLSPADNDDWGSNQLVGPISPGATQTLNITWAQSTVKLIAEDQDGCFLSTTVDVTGSPTWTITNEASRDCGG